MNKEQEQFYRKLKNLLNDTSSWPSEYIFKLIFKSNPENIEKLKLIFHEPKTIFNLKTSKNKKYTSVSIKIIAQNSDFIIDKYKIVGNQIENVILL
jgi:putative lipoic acid-binding regulatory protein